MIQYEGSIYRPPSEARSLILQATIGCSNNQCAFCVAYREKRFRVRPEADLFAEIDWVAGAMPEVRRVFLADGDALVLSTDRMLRILEKLYAKLTNLERVTAYGSPQNFLHKSVADLKRLREAGLTMVYYGIESGDDEILKRIRKGATAEDTSGLSIYVASNRRICRGTCYLGHKSPRSGVWMRLRFAPCWATG